MKSKDNRLIDIHVSEHGKNGKSIYGVPYASDSLTGEGKINGQQVNCMSPHWMFKFKLWSDDTCGQPRKKDIWDAKILYKKFGFELPNKYKGNK